VGRGARRGGGVGLAAVELAGCSGRVLAAASTPAKLSLCLDKGAEAAVDYTTEDLKVRIKEITGWGHAVIDRWVARGRTGPAGPPMGRPVRFRRVRFRGDPRLPLNLVLLKGVVVTGFTMEGFSRHRPDDEARDRPNWPSCR